MSQKVFDNDLVASRQSKITLTFNKPAYGAVCIFDLSKVSMYEFHQDYIKIIMVTTKYGNYYSMALVV